MSADSAVVAARTPEHSARYKRYIASPEWAKKRTEYFQQFGRVCRACNSTDHLHVHHLSYEHLGSEPLSDLACLCETCHNLVHALHDSGADDLRTVTDRFITDARKAAMLPAGKTAGQKARRQKQSKRTVKFNKRVVPACLGRGDRCRNPAPSGSGFCWQHDRTLGTDQDAGTPPPRVIAAQKRDALARERLGLPAR